MTIKLASTVMSKKRNQTPMMAQLTTQPPPTHANARKRSGSVYAHAITFGKDASRVSLQIFVTQSTSSSTPS